jgi:ATP-dependent Clp protease ATP-binding subunit ClpB
MNHQRITPEHLLKALLEDSEGMAAGLIKARAAMPRPRRAEVDGAGQGSGRVGRRRAATPGLDNDAVRVLDQAEQIAPNRATAMSRSSECCWH